MGSIRLEPFKNICMEYRLVYAAPPHLRGHTFARYRSFSHIRTIYLISLRVPSAVMNKAVEYITCLRHATNWHRAEYFALFRKSLSGVV